MRESLSAYVDIRHRIDSVRDTKHQMFLKGTYLLGLSRPAELASVPDPTCKSKRVYGPIGTDVTIEQINLPLPTSDELLALLSKVENQELSITQLKEMLTRKIDVALFKIKLTKRKVVNEQVPYRYIALPINNEFADPWTKELYDYFKKADKSYVFPDFKRKDCLDFIKYTIFLRILT